MTSGYGVEKFGARSVQKRCFFDPAPQNHVSSETRENSEFWEVLQLGGVYCSETIVTIVTIWHFDGFPNRASPGGNWLESGLAWWKPASRVGN